MMIKLTLDNLYTHLKKSYDAKLQDENKQIHIMLKVGEQEVPLFVGVLHEALVQMIAYLPYEMKEGSAGDVARFLHHLNKELDMPGFGMDEKAGLLFYRLVIPCLKPEVDGELVDAHLKTLERALQSVLEGIAAVTDPKSQVGKAAKVAQMAQKIQPKKV
ncbi:MAG: YbjN domain-containing protein [Parachlamydiales bacterium]